MMESLLKSFLVGLMVLGSTNTMALQLTSSVFSNGGDIPTKYTCEGNDISPPLAITSPHPDTISMTLIVDDPDATIGVWDHWVVYNINPATREIPEAANMAGIGTEGKTSWGKTHNYYGGPCPPFGKHHYRFKLYALNKKLDLPAGADKASVEKAMSGHILDQTMLVGLYQKQKK
jgi:Raf kinase inhibitor-like YbhB/YbcL family protein